MDLAHVTRITFYVDWEKVSRCTGGVPVCDICPRLVTMLELLF